MILFILLLLALLIYSLLISLITLLICLNSRKIKKKYGLENIILFMAIYLFNFLIDQFFFNLLPYYTLQILHTFLMIFIVSTCSNLQILGLTGGIACGKSTATKIIQDILKFDIIDCDVLARVIVEPGRPAYKQIVSEFGNQILTKNEENSEIDRTKLGQLVFSNITSRRKLMKITSYYIFLELLRELYKVFFIQKKTKVLLDAPILFESKYLEYICYPIILVYVTEEKIQIERMKTRNGYDEEQARQRIKSQMSLADKLKKSDILLNNEGTVEDLSSNILKTVPLYFI